MSQQMQLDLNDRDKQYAEEPARGPVPEVVAELTVAELTVAELTVAELTDGLVQQLRALPLEQHVEALNYIRARLHSTGPFADQPVDLVQWVPAAQVHANDYNPNAVAPPEMRLLQRSVEADGFTQPIVAFSSEQEGTDEIDCATSYEIGYEIVDGFHRNRVGREVHVVRERIHGYLPLAIIRTEQAGRSNRIASTIRHNRARGSHNIDLMVGIVRELVEAGMSDEWICRNIGMDADELLRFKQVGGIAALFRDRTFNQAWVKSSREVAFYKAD